MSDVVAVIGADSPSTIAWSVPVWCCVGPNAVDDGVHAVW